MVWNLFAYISLQIIAIGSIPMPPPILSNFMNIMHAYIKPRKKKENEDKKENLMRRLEESIEYFHACRDVSHYKFLEELRNYIYHN